MERLLALQRLQFGANRQSVQAEVDKLRENVPAPILAHYDRLAERGKKGLAIARNGVCGECHLRITSGKLINLVCTDEVEVCDNCGRYLYLPEDEPIMSIGPKSGPSTPAKRRSQKRADFASDSRRTAITLADFTSSSLIVPHLRGGDAASAIQELSQCLHRERQIADLLPFYHAALNREFMISSDMESGIAFPHARLPGLKELSFAFGRSDNPLSWGPRAAGTVRLVFLMAVPATDLTQYLLFISGLARLTKEQRLVERLYAAQEALEILEVLSQIELRSSPSVDQKWKT
jgi:mannitol/fructose-specific phosphotransferase system IIA component (Ntr-type)